MASQTTKFAVGLFLIIGFVAALISMTWLGVTGFLKTGREYVTYFNESVQGLSVDSQVKYRGVEVGRVQEIDVGPSGLIEVIISIERDESEFKVDETMFAQLKAIGITGTMLIELDRKKEGEEYLYIKGLLPYQQIASKPSTIAKFMDDANQILGQIKNMKLDVIASQVSRELERVDDILVDADIKTHSNEFTEVMKAAKETLLQAQTALVRAEETLGTVKTIAAENRESVRAAITELRAAAQNARSLTKSGDNLAKDADRTLVYLSRNLLVVSEKLEKASDNLDLFLEKIADQPPELLFGDPPPRRKVEK